MSEKQFDDENLKNVAGGMVNWDGSYSFYAGQVIYLDKNRKTYVVVKEASNFVDANYQVPIEYHSNVKAFEELFKTLSAASLQEAVDKNY